MTDKKAVTTTVETIVEELKKNPSTRFSKSDFQMLIWGILSDKEFKAKKYVLRNNELLEEDGDIGAGMTKFLDKLLKHAGVSEPAERAKIIDGFEYNSRDIEWVADAVDEAMYIYTEAGKNMKVFRDKMLQLTLKKIARTGSHAGSITYKKAVVNRALAVSKKAAAKKPA